MGACVTIDNILGSDSHLAVCDPREHTQVPAVKGHTLEGRIRLMQSRESILYLERRPSTGGAEHKTHC